MRQYYGFITAIAAGCVFSLSPVAPSQIRAQEAGTSGSPSVDSLRFKFDVAKGALEKPIEELNGKYAASLKALQEKVRKAGELERTLAVKNELEGFAEGKTKPAEDFDELARLQRIYDKQSQALNRTLGKQLKPLLEDYQKNLAALKAELTKENKLEQAVVAAEEEKRVQAMLANLPTYGLGSSSRSNEEKNEEQGLLLTVGKETQIWKNELVSLPGQTPIYFTGTLKIPPEGGLLRLRGQKAYGSDRLVFFVSRKERRFDIEVDSTGSHRYVTVEVPEGTESLPIKIGKDAVSNNWEWGPLQWSFNDRTWRDVPLKNLSPK